ncbi:anti-sigma factor [Pseudonocardia acaciae]|uniref:anti-sigma factor n=1 Tax=Pseudonocardia acaciae TaxID=551276 RepID=UPI000A068719|nr:anti-sigma factor [Pseudonocardia acaciae]
MTGKPACPRAEEAVGWAMHALEPAEEEVLVAHLPCCEPCREAVRQAEELVRVLASVGDRVEPRAELREELLASVAATAQTPRERRQRPPDLEWEPAPPPPPPPPSHAGWDPGAPELDALAAGPAEARRWAARRRGTVVLVASMLVAMIVIGIGGMATRQMADTQQRQAAAAQQLQRVLAQASAVGVRSAVLSAPGGPPVAAVLLDGGQRQLVPAGLPANEPDRSTYVLWGLGGPRPVPLGTFDVNPGDRGARTVGSMPRDDTFTGYAVSIERGRKAPPSPTVMMIASGQVTR